MGRPMHFEIHATDPGAAARFYTELFGWTANTWADVPYRLLDTGAGPGINGAIIQRRGPAPAVGAPVMGAVIVVGVADLDATVARAADLGAAIVVARHPVTGVGWSAYFRDPDENVVGLFQDDVEAR